MVTETLEKLRRHIEWHPEAGYAPLIKEAIRALEAALSTDADPVAWVSPIELRAWQRKKAGEIWAWSENLEGQCVPLYAGPVKPDFFEVEEIREQKLATIAAPDNGTTAEVLAAVLECAEAWVPEARIIGNVRAGDIARVVRSALSAQVQDVAVKSFIVDYVYSDNEVKTRTFAYDAEQEQAEAFCKEVKANGGSVNVRIAAAPAAKLEDKP